MGKETGKTFGLNIKNFRVDSDGMAIDAPGNRWKKQSASRSSAFAMARRLMVANPSVRSVMVYNRRTHKDVRYIRRNVAGQIVTNDYLG